MPERPFVTVVIPLYNKRSTIGRTLESVLAQRHGDFEIIVVDDGSTDGGPDLVGQRYDDPRVRLYTQLNSGPGAARNRGARMGRGGFIAFLDADDEWYPEFLEQGLASLAAEPACAAFTCSFHRGVERDDRWQELRPFGFRQGPWRLTPQIGRDELSHCLAAFSSSSAIYRREAFEAYGGFYTAERCTFGEDVYLWIQILLNHAIFRHLTPLAHYHTEDSELGIGGRQGPFPLEPVLTHPEPIRAACPPALRPALELWLAQHAARAAFMQLDRGDAANAAWLVEAFPQVAALRQDYLKLRVRMKNPKLWTFARSIASALPRVTGDAQR